MEEKELRGPFNKYQERQVDLVYVVGVNKRKPQEVNGL